MFWRTAFLCIFQIIFGSAIAQAQSSDSMSWRQILNKAGPPVQPAPQEPAYPRAAAIPSGPSFDCKRAKNSNEKLICESSELSELDQKMSTLFDDLVKQLNRSDREELRQHQHKWLKERIDCGDDFLCTKTAYSQRIDRLTSVLSKIGAKASTTESDEQCRVAVPEPPLNIRTSPNGSIVGSLSNEARVVVLDYNANKTWAFVGKMEDRFPVGWVFTEYLDCKSNGTEHAIAPGLMRYDCGLTRQFPGARKRDKASVVGTTVLIAYEGERFVGMDVSHELQSGVVHKRSQQYRNFKISTYGFDDGGYWRWTGVLAKDRSISMKGQLSVSGEEYDYTEQQTANGNLTWVAIWSCHERRANTAN
jgi:uncharacterized protein